METEILLNVKIEALEEGGFLATSSELPGLVVQGRTRSETMELAQANARILLEAYFSEVCRCPPILVSPQVWKEISAGVEHRQTQLIFASTQPLFPAVQRFREVAQDAERIP